MPTTDPDGIFYADSSTPMSAEAISAAQATSVQLALSTGGYRLREIVPFTSTRAFTKATYPWLRAIRVRCQGAGGGGGGSASPSAGKGGGGGCYAEKLITDIAGLAASVTVTVGTGGAGGAAGANSGAAGGQSAYGTTTAGGGSGGAGGSVVTTFPQSGALSGGVGGSTSANADLTIPGSNSVIGASLRAVSVGFGGAVGSGGGDSVLGKGGAPNATAIGGSAGTQGGGGGAGYSGSGDGNIAGLGGGNGIVILELFA